MAQELYCPKCKQTFEEGSRRFCPTDGSRLISEAAESARQRGGVFSHLLPKVEADTRRDETLAAKPRPRGVSEAPELSSIGGAGDTYFEFEDIELELELETEKQKEFFNPPPEPTRADQPRIEPLPAETARVEPPRPEPPRKEPGRAESPIPEPRAEPSRPVARKVSPHEIPKGHVSLDDDRPIFNVDFDTRDPEGFVGRVVKGRYKVTEFLGGDNRGLAYLAEDKLSDDRKVLVRILLEEAVDEVMISILAEERVSLSHLSHPNIARLIDSGEFTGGTQFLVTEYIDALSVRDALEIHGRFDPQRTARVIKQVAYALNEAHQQGILHRDIRPENIILDPLEDGTEQAMVVNFGTSEGEPNPYNMQYKAPEVLDGRIGTVSSDIFSLAVVSYEMLTGRVPFAGDTVKEVMRSNLSGIQLPVSAVSPGVSRAVDDTLGRALALSATNRFAKARDFGDALFASLSDPAARVAPAPPPPKAAPPVPRPKPAAPPPIAEVVKKPVKPVGETVKLMPLASQDEPAWKSRSPEPIQTGSSRSRMIAAIGIPALALLAALGFYLIYTPVPQPPSANANSLTNGVNANPNLATSNEVPPLPRSIQQPPNSSYYQNTKPNLKGDLLLNYVGFSLFYPNDWKVNGPQPGANANIRGKFLDISRETPDGRMQEQMLISYYPSKGTFHEDADRFPQMVKETNETLAKLLPNYQMISEGEYSLNGGWRTYEVKFQGSGTSPTGEKLIVWGRRLFIPAARPGVRNGFEITMLATSLAPDVKSVDDVGQKGELAGVLATFEPSQSF
jgi:serine/threonine protein kinase